MSLPPLVDSRQALARPFTADDLRQACKAAQRVSPRGLEGFALREINQALGTYVLAARAVSPWARELHAAAERVLQLLGKREPPPNGQHILRSAIALRLPLDDVRSTANGLEALVERCLENWPPADGAREKHLRAARDNLFEVAGMVFETFWNSTYTVTQRQRDVDTAAGMATFPEGPAMRWTAALLAQVAPLADELRELAAWGRRTRHGLPEAIRNARKKLISRGSPARKRRRMREGLD